MKWLGIKKVPLSRIKVEGSFNKRKKEAHVKDLAKSIERSGVIALPVISTTNELIAGGDRLAALMLNGVKSHEVRVVQGDVRELAILQVEENLRRRVDNRDELILRYVDLVEGGSTAQLPVAVTGNAGRPKSTRGAAREQVALQLGTTPEAVRSAEKRASEGDVHVHEWVACEDDGDGVTSVCACGEHQAPIPPPVDTWDVPVDHLAQEFAQVRIAQAAIDETDRHLRAAQRALSALRPEISDLGSVTSAVYSRIYHQLHQVADEVRRSRPDVLCVYCKGLAHRRGTCGGCLNLGYLSKDSLEHIAPELLARGDKAVVVNGRGGFETLAQASTPKREPVRAQPKKKGIKIEGPADTVYNPETESFEEDLF